MCSQQTRYECSVVVPTFREAGNLEPLCRRVQLALIAAGISYEIIVIDDDSRDGSAEEIERIQAQGIEARILIRKGERGLSSAVLKGLREAKGDVLACMDADLSHPPEKLPDLVRPIQRGEADFAIGSRYVIGGSTEQGWGLFRWINSRVATFLARPFTRATDPMSGFFALHRDRFASADALNPVGYKIGLELLVKCHCRTIKEVPLHFAKRTKGESKLTLREQWLYIKHIKRLADFRFGWLSHFFQFCFVGGTGMVVDLSVYKALLWITRGWWISVFISRAIAIGIAMTWNFWLNRRLTFSYSRHGNIWKQYSRFITTCSVGAVVSWSLSVGLAKFVSYFYRHVLLAAFLGIIAGTFFNFFLSRNWAFAENNPGINKEGPS